MNSRRNFLLGASLFPLLALRAFDARGREASAAVAPPRSSFDKTSTAEEVTAELDLSGKVALVTGCSAGIGYETLRVLVLRGAHVYGVARTLEKAERACAAASTGVKGRATPFACEQTSFSSVAKCADAVQARHVPLDILICNAGVYSLPTLELAEGLEKQFVVNHLSHFIMVNRLLNLIQSAPQGRIVVVGSAAFALAPEGGIEFDNLSGQRSYDTWKAYGQSKLANALFARSLAHRLSATRVTSNVLSPGLVLTDRAVEVLRSRDPQTDPKKNPAAKTVEQGAATTCYVATSPALEKVSGQYFDDCQIVVPHDKRIYDDALAEKLWATSEDLTRTYLPKA